MESGVAVGRRPLSVAALFFGLFLLVALLVGVAGFGVGTPELLLWLALVVGGSRTGWCGAADARTTPQVIVMPPSTGSVWPVM
jgi:hypothetical protein